MTAFQTPSAFTLPPALSSLGYALRPEADDDIPFLMRLYASTREDEFKGVQWSAEQKQAFLESQFHAQRRHYLTYFDGCAFDVLQHHGVAVGRLYLDERPTRLHIIDIALLPEWRGCGTGTAILRALQAAGRASGKSVGIMVEMFNPALRLYQRLGFTAVADHGVYLEMAWVPVYSQLNVA